MTTSTASAPGKAILFGEHAVVYGRAAIAVPVAKVKATAAVTDAPAGSGCTIAAPDVGARVHLSTPNEDPLALAVRLAIEEAGIEEEPDWQITVRSDIPIAGGMGSGAAVSAALVKAVFAHRKLPAHRRPKAETVNRIVYAVEKLHHANPSGIDNTVVVSQQPVRFVRGQPPQRFDIARPFHLVIADTGIASSTAAVVSDVRRAWEQDTDRYEAIFDGIGEIAETARRAIESGNVDALGPLMKENHRLLRKLNVSSGELERLIAIAEEAGAAGAKLSGAGRGGNLIAAVELKKLETVQKALLAGGAAGIVVTQIGA
ncbi:MAG: mevalonate kinase [Caldilineaceae bacterium SB0665_bin_25]|nr:mevalonate kinase [Caldilineaceae bacterium SB0665_bin_25]